jgi:uncharacterized protein (TIGR00725 family)
LISEILLILSKDILSTKIKVGVMGSAEDAASSNISATAHALALEMARRDLILLTGATTGLIHSIGKVARDAGAFHLGISPAANEHEHVEQYLLPTDACDAIVYTGFGLKGRNVVLVRSCDVVLFVAGSIGSLNEFTIAYDEGKTIGCLIGTGGVADQVMKIVDTFQKPTKARIFYDENPKDLISRCLAEVR